MNHCLCTRCPNLGAIRRAVADCADCPDRRADCGENCPKLVKLRRQCLACNPESEAGFPRGRISLDDCEGVLAPSSAYIASRTPSRAVPSLSEEQEQAAAAVLREFADLDRDELEIVWTLLRDLHGTAAAAALGLRSRQLLHYRLKGLLAKHPLFAALWNGRTLGARQARKASTAR